MGAAIDEGALAMPEMTAAMFGDAGQPRIAPTIAGPLDEPTRTEVYPLSKLIEDARTFLATRSYDSEERMVLRWCVDALEKRAGEPFLTQLRRVNQERYDAWTDGNEAGIMFDALELGGEVGELLNVVKKLEREERGWRGSRATPQDFADECADVLICLDKLARRRGVDLVQATTAKFNATSDKVGLPHRLSGVELLPESTNSGAAE